MIQLLIIASIAIDTLQRTNITNMYTLNLHNVLCQIYFNNKRKLYLR